MTLLYIICASDISQNVDISLMTVRHKRSLCLITDGFLQDFLLSFIELLFEATKGSCMTVECGSSKVLY